MMTRIGPSIRSNIIGDAALGVILSKVATARSQQIRQ
jgi:hypothetical protein